MEFIKHNFKVGDRVTVAQLNEIEDGIIEAAQSGGSAEAAIEQILNGATSITNFKAVENNFASMGQALSDMGRGLSRQGAQISAVEQNVESLATHVDTELDGLAGTLQTQININKDGINLVMEELGLTIDPKQEFSGAEGESKISLLETGLNLVGTKTEAHELLLDNILDDLGLTELTETDFPIDGERTSTRALAQYSNDAVNIVLHELGLDEAAEEEYPVENTDTRTIAEKIADKADVIVLDSAHTYTSEEAKEIASFLNNNPNTIIRIIPGNWLTYSRLDVVAIKNILLEAGGEIQGLTVDEDIYFTLTDINGEFTLTITQPVPVA